MLRQQHCAACNLRLLFYINHRLFPPRHLTLKVKASLSASAIKASMSAGTTTLVEGRFFSSTRIFLRTLLVLISSAVIIYLRSQSLLLCSTISSSATISSGSYYIDPPPLVKTSQTLAASAATKEGVQQYRKSCVYWKVCL